MESMISREELSRRLQQLMFYAVELNLYLDTHPNDVQALRDYNFVLQNIEKYKRLYTQSYGSLLNFGHATVTGNTWSWVSEDNKWPWENK